VYKSEPGKLAHGANLGKEGAQRRPPILNDAHATDLKSSAFCTFESIEIARRIFGLDPQQPHFGATRRTLKKGSEWFSRRLSFIHDEH
jgi:hypothetical protein